MSALKGPSPNKGETIVIAITTHGAVLTQRTDADKIIPEIFFTPVKLIKYSAVAFGVCNIVEDKIIKNNIEHLITEFKTRRLIWDTMSDEDIITSLESITQKYKDEHKRLVKGVSGRDIEEWSKSEKEIDKEKLGFFYNAHLGHTINTYEKDDEVTEKAYTLGGISDEAARTGNALYSDKILLFAPTTTFDLYDQLAGDNPGVLLSELIQTLDLQEKPISRIVVIDFTCNESLDSLSVEEKGILRDEERVKLGGKQNKTKKSIKSTRKSIKSTRKSIKSTSKSRKTKKSRKSRRKR
jgi:hypothetical protein